MTKLFKTLMEGSPSQIHDEVFTSLDSIVETNLQEQRKITITKMFGKNDDINESVSSKQKMKWDNKAIRQVLEEATLIRLQNDAMLKESYGRIEHMHHIVTSKGFEHKSSYPARGGHMNVYKHPEGHNAYIHTDNNYQLITGSGAHMEGQGHTSLSHHLKHLDEDAPTKTETLPPPPPVKPITVPDPGRGWQGHSHTQYGGRFGGK